MCKIYNTWQGGEGFTICRVRSAGKLISNYILAVCMCVWYSSIVFEKSSVWAFHKMRNVQHRVSFWTYLWSTQLYYFLIMGRWLHPGICFNWNHHVNREVSPTHHCEAAHFIDLWQHLLILCLFTSWALGSFFEEITSPFVIFPEVDLRLLNPKSLF